jgi:hypothetical protein
MRWLGLLIFTTMIAATLAMGGIAHAVPQPDAESAFSRGDYQTAFNLYMPLAEQGSVAAQERIAEMYDKGLGVPQDEAKAREWYRRSAEQSAKDAEMKMEAAQGVASPQNAQGQTTTIIQYVPVMVPTPTPTIVPITPMRVMPSVRPASWPPVQQRPVQPYYVPAPSHYHHHHR